LRSIFLFEIRYHLKYPLIYCLALVFFLFTFGAEVSDSFQLGGSIGNEYRNAPIVILRWLTIMSIMGLLVVTAFVAGSIQRDFARNTYELIFSRPVGKFDYLMGRFSGSMMLTLWVIIGSVLGIIVGSYMPWLEPERLGPFRLVPYLYALFVIILPNLFLIGAVFFTLAGLTRSMLSSFMGAIFILVAWAISAFAMKGLEGEFLASLLDPFGFAALTVSTKYWTIIEKNTALPPVEGALLLNRLIWIGIGLAVFIYGYYSFHFTEAAAKKRFGRKSRIIEEPDSAFPDDVDRLIQTRASASRTFSLPTSLRQLWCRTRLETVGVFKSIPFIVILVFSVFNVFGGVVVTGDLMGTPIYPVTHTMLQAIHNSYLFMLIIIITFYSGELVWREQSLKLNEVIDSLPVPNWVFLGSKLLTLSLVVVIFTLAGVFATMGYQIYRGYTNFEIGLYTKGIAMAVYPYILICVLACTIQVLANNKILGYLLMIIYLVSAGALEVLGLEHYIYQYARSPNTPYSDMNGYGHFLQPFFWYNLYWTFAAVILGVLCSMFWVRGTESGWKTRLKLKGPRLRSPARTALILGLLGFISSGVFIFYNTCVLNEYLPKQENEKRLAEYEKRYRQYKDVAMPRITDVKADVDIYPEDRRVEIEGRYLMENRSSAPIDSLHVTIPPRVTIRDIRFRDNEPVLEDSVLGYYIYELGGPLLPGDTLAFDFDLIIENPGFVNNGSNVRIVKNGTFIDNMEFFPTLGYQRV